jgi:hypothetical protein
MRAPTEILRGGAVMTSNGHFRGEVNPGFFKGTAVEEAAAEVLAQPAVRA